MDITLFLDEISPFVSVSSVAPVSLKVPRNVVVTFRASSHSAESRFLWTGATEVSDDGFTSVATQRYSKPGSYMVVVTSALVDPTLERNVNTRAISVLVGTVRASDVRIRMTEPLAGSTEVGPIYKDWPCTAGISHPEYSHLIQWTATGASPSSGFGPAFNPKYSAKAKYQMKVGPDNSQKATFDIYEVSRVSYQSASGEAVDYGAPIIFLASTDPPGREEHVVWRVDTHADMFTRATSAAGRGGSFTTVLNPTSDAGAFWAQVYADYKAAFANPDLPNSGTPFDPFTKVTCTAAPGQLPLRVEQDRFKSESDACGAGCSLGAVQLSPGEFNMRVVDLEIPGRGIPFRFERAYRSQYTCNGPLGNNWDFNYNMRLMAELDGGGMPTGNVFLLDGLGRSDLFVRNLDGTFATPPGHYRRLTRNPDLTYTLLERDGTQIFFSVIIQQANYRAFLSGISDRNGNTLTFLYYPSNSRLAEVIDTLGRSVFFSYNSIGRLDHITDFAGRTERFLYDVNGDLTFVESPHVATGSTPTGNDFPLGKTTKYTYSFGFADVSLNHNLLTVTRPNEVALNPDGPPVIVNTYGTDTGVPIELDKVLRQTVGGLNAAASARGIAAAGGNITYFYQTLNPGADPNNLTISRNRVTVVDRVGNTSVYEQNSLGGNITRQEYTGRVNPNLARSALQSLIPSNNPSFPPIPRLRSSDPPFFLTSWTLNSQGEISLVTKPETNSVSYSYNVASSDRLQQGNVLQVTQTADAARGGDQTSLTTLFTYEPIYNQIRTACDPRGSDPSFVPPVDPGVTGCARYAAKHTFDYEEACSFASIAGSTGRSTSEVQSLLTAAGMCSLPLGDVNGDGVTNQIRGNEVRTDHPTVHLLAGSNQAIVEGDPLQEIVQIFSYNGFGQLTKRIDPEGNVDEYLYHAENDPDGDGANLTFGRDTSTGGYLKQITKDTTSAPSRDSGTNPTPTNIRHQYFYDGAGNVIREIDGRGIETRFAVNALNQVVQTTRAYAHNVLAPDPAEPIALTDFQYLERTFYDFNDNVVQRSVEDRGNTSNTGGFVDVGSAFDILNRMIEETKEVNVSQSLVTGYRYDANVNKIEVIEPEENFDTTTYDERNLVFQRTRGAGGPFGGTASTSTRHYDRNRNLIEAVDAADTDGSSANNSTIGGVGDRTRFIFDGFDRKTSTVDSVGNQTVIQYDPEGNVIRVARFGPVGGPSPTSDGPSVLQRPVSSSGVIQVSNLVTANLLDPTLTLFDELNRPFQADRSLFVNTIPTARPADVNDGAADVGKGDLTPGDTCSIPGVAAPPSGYLGCVSTRREFDRDSRSTFTVEDDLDTSRNFYDGADRVIKELDPEGNTVEMAYDDDGNVIETRETDVSQVAGVQAEIFLTTGFFDSLNRLQQQIDNAGHTVDFRYDSRGNLVATADPQGPPGPVMTRRVFPSGPRTVNTTNLFGNVMLRSYDGANRKTEQQIVLTAGGQGDGVNIGATIEGVKTTTPAPDPSQSGDGLLTITYDWDDDSRQTSITDDNGNQTFFQYDNLDRLINETNGQCSPPFLADRCDAPTSSTYLYDPDDNVVSGTDENGSVFSCAYDALNREGTCTLTRAAGVLGTTSSSMEWDGASRLTRATDNNEPAVSGDDSVVTFAYDSLNRVIEETEEIGANASKPISAAWRAANLRTALTYPNGRAVVNTFDHLDRRRTIEDQGMTSPITTYDFIGPVRVAQRTYPINGSRLTYLDNGGTADTGYDGLRRPIALRHLRSNNSTIAAFAHRFDRDSNKLMEEKAHVPSDSELYARDSAYRLLHFRRGTLNATKDAVTVPSPRTPVFRDWTLDGAHNWKQVDSEARQHSSFNEIIQRNPAGMVQVQSDSNGNTVDDGVYLYAWDAVNRLRVVRRKSDNALIAEYAYDAMSRRIRRTVTNSPGLNGTTDYYSDSVQEIEERGSGDALRSQFVYGRGADGLLVMDRNLNGDGIAIGPGDERLFFHENSLGSTMALTDTAGAVVEGYLYDPYGTQTLYLPGANGVVDFGGDDTILQDGVSPRGNPYLFAGRRLDPEDGNYYFRNRFVSSTLGRFLSRDPVGFWGDSPNLGNAYPYVADRPVDHRDPFGLQDFVALTNPRALAVAKMAQGALADDVAYAIRAPLNVVALPAGIGAPGPGLGLGGGQQCRRWRLKEQTSQPVKGSLIGDLTTPGQDRSYSSEIKGAYQIVPMTPGGFATTYLLYSIDKSGWIFDDFEDHEVGAKWSVAYCCSVFDGVLERAGGMGPVPSPRNRDGLAYAYIFPETHPVNAHKVDLHVEILTGVEAEQTIMKRLTIKLGIKGKGIEFGTESESSEELKGRWGMSWNPMHDWSVECECVP